LLNVHATHLVAEAARENHVPRLVFASSAAVYGNNADLPLGETSTTMPISPYGAAKLASEALLLGHAHTYGLTVRCQRYFNVYGSRQDAKSPYAGVLSLFVQNLRTRQPVTVYGDGHQTRDFISVEDVARANVLAATLPGIPSGTVNICTGQKVSLRTILGVLAHHFPCAASPLYAEPRGGDIVHSLGDASKARAELGFNAAVSIEIGLTEFVKSEVDS
jgi:UDP-glucose 4-epimerase